LSQGIGPQETASPQFAVGTDFTYQGRVLDNGTPANSTCDFQFTLYDDNVLSLTQVSSPVQQTNITVTDGYFTASVDFSTGAFTGEGRQLAFGVRCPAGSDSYTTLTGMIPIRAAPYAHSLRPEASVQSTGTALNSSCSSTSGSALVPFWKLCHPGTVASTVKTEERGNQKLYATQSTDPWVDHFGAATLAQGSVTVPIDMVFAQTVSLDHYHFFLTPLGDCNGLFVEAKAPRRSMPES